MRRIADKAGWLRWAATGVFGSIVLILVAQFPVSGDSSTSICFSRRVLDFSCPGCGMTRALVSLLNGRVGDSLTFHPLLLPFAVEAVLLWLAWPFVLLNLIPKPSLSLINGFLLAHAVLLIAAWAVRFAIGTLP